MSFRHQRCSSPFVVVIRIPLLLEAKKKKRPGYHGGDVEKLSCVLCPLLLAVLFGAFYCLFVIFVFCSHRIGHLLNTAPLEIRFIYETSGTLLSETMTRFSPPRG